MKYHCLKFNRAISDHNFHFQQWRKNTKYNNSCDYVRGDITILVQLHITTYIIFRYNYMLSDQHYDTL